MKDSIFPETPVNRCAVFVRTAAKPCSGEIQRPARRYEFLTRPNRFRSFRLTANEFTSANYENKIHRNHRSDRAHADCRVYSTESAEPSKSSGPTGAAA